MCAARTMTRGLKDKTKDTPDQSTSAESVNALVYQICESKEFINKISEMFACLVKDAVKQQVISLEQRNDELSDRIRELEKQVAVQNSDIDALKQKSKNSSLCFFGVDESQREDTRKVILDVITSKIGIDMCKEEIISCYRIGKTRDDGRTRPVLVYFSVTQRRDTVYKAKSKLKSTKIIIRENLTKGRMLIVKGALEAFGSKQVWTMHGVVCVRTGDSVHRILNTTQLQELCKVHAKSAIN